MSTSVSVESSNPNPHQDQRLQKPDHDVHYFSIQSTKKVSNAPEYVFSQSERFTLAGSPCLARFKSLLRKVLFVMLKVTSKGTGKGQSKVDRHL